MQAIDLQGESKNASAKWRGQSLLSDVGPQYTAYISARG